MILISLKKITKVSPLNNFFKIPEIVIDKIATYKSKWFKGLEHRVNIDETLSFSEWVVDQKLIVSPTSLSSLEAYLSNVPVINIDKIIGIDEYNKNYSKLTLEWHQLANETDKPLKIVEIQYGKNCVEEDIERL